MLNQNPDSNITITIQDAYLHPREFVIVNSRAAVIKTFPIAVALGVVVSFSMPDDAFLRAFTLVGSIVAVIAVEVLLVSAIRWWQVTRPASKVLLKPKVVIFDEFGIKVRLPDSSNSETSWNLVDAAYRYRSLTILMISSFSGIYVPDRWFKDQDERNQFFKLIGEKVKWKRKFYSLPPPTKK